MKHIPVLANEILEFFSDLEIHDFLDGTCGAGGHAQVLLHKHQEIQNYYALDKDKCALEIAAETLEPFGKKVHLIHAGFETMDTLFPKESMDAILLDIGVSSMQLDQTMRGFSFSKEGPLDMRMDQSAPLDAEKIVNTFSERELGRIFREYGEERHWRKAARAIVYARGRKKIKTTYELVHVLKSVFPSFHGGRIHPATRIFQALRIAVNQELEALEQGLSMAFSLLKPKGKLAVISFHSLEDRIVKHTFRAFPQAKILTKKPIRATSEEVKYNKRSRSAKLRVVEKK